MQLPAGITTAAHGTLLGTTTISPQLICYSGIPDMPEWTLDDWWTNAGHLFVCVVVVVVCKDCMQLAIKLLASSRWSAAAEWVELENQEQMRRLLQLSRRLQATCTSKSTGRYADLQSWASIIAAAVVVVVVVVVVAIIIIVVVSNATHALKWFIQNGSFLRWSTAENGKAAIMRPRWVVAL